MLRTLLTLARDNPGAGNAKLAAAIVKKRKVLAFGFNRMKSHPLQKRFGKNPHAIFLHAELDAITNAIRRHGEGALAGSTLYIARVRRDGTAALAKPCTGCEEAIKVFGIERVEWTR